MTLQNIVEILIGLALIAWICVRQLTWRPVDVVRMLRLPLILAVIGVVVLARTKLHAFTGAGAVLVLAELGLSAVTGAAMGAIARFRPVDEGAGPQGAGRSRLGRRDVGRPRSVAFETRTGWLGIALWGVLIAARIGMDAAAGAAGSALSSATGMILVMIAVNRLVRVGVILGRSRRLPRAAVLA